MSRLDELPPDQRAALSLLLRQRKSYAEVALLLGIAERAVHDRAHAAIAVLAPRQAREIAPEQRAEVADYLLGQAGVAERLRTRTYLAGSEQARVWAQAVAVELTPLAGSQLPEIPTAAPTAPAAPGASPVAPTPSGPSPSSSRPVPISEVAASLASGAGSQGDAFATSTSSPSSSRLGGALLLAALVVAVVVAVILLSSGGGSKNPKKTASSGTSSTGTTGTGTTSTGKTPAVIQLPLHSPSAKSRTVGVVAVISEKGKHAFYIEAQHLPATRHFFYAIWLYNSHTSAEALSKAPAVGSTHKLAGGSTLPTNAGEFREILLTRETSSHPTHPGHLVLRGAFKLSS